MKKLFLVLLLSANIIGCQAISRKINPDEVQAVPWPWDKDNMPCKSETCKQEEIRLAYLQASQFCRELHNYYLRKSTKTKGGRFWLTLTGAIAGSVVAPISGESTTNAMAGIAGATNAANTALDNFFSEASNLKKRAAIAQATLEGQHKFNSEMVDSKKLIIAFNMASECAMSSSEIDKSTLQSVLNANTSKHSKGDHAEKELSIAELAHNLERKKLAKAKSELKSLQYKKIDLLGSKQSTTSIEKLIQSKLKEVNVLQATVETSYKETL